MLTICNSAEMARALASPIDLALKLLLTRRRDQLLEYDDYDLGELASFVVVEPADSESAIEGGLGFSPAVNFVDEARFGESDFEPSWEWIEQHGEWYEMVFVLSDDGFGHVLLVPDREGVEPSLLTLCRRYGRPAA